MALNDRELLDEYDAVAEAVKDKLENEDFRNLARKYSLEQRWKTPLGWDYLREHIVKEDGERHIYTFSVPTTSPYISLVLNKINELRIPYLSKITEVSNRRVELDACESLLVDDVEKIEKIITNTLALRR